MRVDTTTVLFYLGIPCLEYTQAVLYSHFLGGTYLLEVGAEISPHLLTFIDLEEYTSLKKWFFLDRIDEFLDFFFPSGAFVHSLQLFIAIPLGVFDEKKFEIFFHGFSILFESRDIEEIGLPYFLIPIGLLL